jgi:DUF2992 family protein
VCEIREQGYVRAARHIFGAEPNNAELAAFAAGPDFAALSARAHAPSSDRRRTSGPEVSPKWLAKLAKKARPDTGIGAGALRDSVAERVRTRQPASAGRPNRPDGAGRSPRRKPDQSIAGR